MSSSPKEIQAEWEMRARIFVNGYTEEDKHGLPTHRFPADGSTRDVEGRIALWRLLASGNLPRDIAETLARSFLPPGSGEKRTRYLRFTFRSAGRQRQDERQTEIAARVFEAIPAQGSVAEAVAKVAGELGLSEEAVLKTWSLYGWAFKEGYL